MSLQVELCEHLAQDCVQAAERTKDPQTRELLLRHAVQWMQDALAELKGEASCLRAPSDLLFIPGTARTTSQVKQISLSALRSRPDRHLPERLRGWEATEVQTALKLRRSSNFLITTVPIAGRWPPLLLEAVAADPKLRVVFKEVLDPLRSLSSAFAAKAAGCAQARQAISPLTTG